MGSDADLVVWDDSRQHSVSVKSQCTRADVNVYEGMSLRGAATHVVYAGHVVVDSEGVRHFFLFSRFAIFITAHHSAILQGGPKK